MILRIFISAIVLSIAFSVSAQNVFQPKQPGEEWKGVIYRKETAFEIKLQTNGPFSIGVNLGEIKSYYKTNYYHLSIGCLSDPRERSKNKNRPLNFTTSRSFSLGKQNTVFVLRGGMGSKSFISEKAKRKGIAIGYSYEIGPSIALLKPEYLEVIKNDNSEDIVLETIKYSEENEDVFLDRTGDVFGGASYFKGFSDMTIVPGIQAKLGLLFSLGAFDKKVW